jgi:hypothetical protein
VDQCQGRTKAGNRCKRSASAGSLYCSTHTDQARTGKSGTGKTGTKSPEADAPEILVGTPEERGALDTLIVAAALGAAVVVVFAFGKLLRL